MFKNFIIFILLIALGFMVAALIKRADQGDTAPASDDETLGDTQVELDRENEGANGSDDSSVENVEELLQGSWGNTEDTAHVTTFREDGTFTDSYSAGAVVENGTYTLVPDVDDLPTDLQEEVGSSGGPFLRQTLGGEDYYYALEVTTDTLELVSLSTGDVQVFELLDS